MSQSDAADALVLKRTVGHSKAPNDSGYGSSCAVGDDSAGNTFVYAGVPWHWPSGEPSPTGGVYYGFEQVYLPSFLGGTRWPVLQGPSAHPHTRFGAALAALPSGSGDKPVAISAPTARSVIDESNQITGGRYSTINGSSPREDGVVILADHAMLRDGAGIPGFDTKLENGTLKHTVIDYQSHCMNLRDGWVAPDPDATSTYTGSAFSAKLQAREAEEAQLASEAPSMNGSFGEVLFMCESASSNNRLLLVGAPRADAPAVWVVERGTVHDGLGYFTVNPTAKAEYFRTSEDADAHVGVLNVARVQSLAGGAEEEANRLATAVAFLEAATGLPTEIWWRNPETLSNVAVSKALFIAMIKGEPANLDEVAADPLAFMPTVAELARRREEVDHAEYEWERLTVHSQWHADRWSSLYTVLVTIYDTYPQAQDEEEALQLAAADGYESAINHIRIRAEYLAAWDRFQLLRSKLAEEESGMEGQVLAEEAAAPGLMAQAKAAAMAEAETMGGVLSNPLSPVEKLNLEVWWAGLHTGGVTADDLRADPSIGLGTKLWEACGVQRPGTHPDGARARAFRSHQRKAGLVFAYLLVNGTSAHFLCEVTEGLPPGADATYGEGSAVDKPIQRPGGDGATPSLFSEQGLAGTALAAVSVAPTTADAAAIPQNSTATQIGPEDEMDVFMVAYSTPRDVFRSGVEGTCTVKRLCVYLKQNTSALTHGVAAPKIGTLGAFYPYATHLGAAQVLADGPAVGVRSAYPEQRFGNDTQNGTAIAMAKRESGEIVLAVGCPNTLVPVGRMMPDETRAFNQGRGVPPLGERLLTPGGWGHVAIYGLGFADGKPDQTGITTVFQGMPQGPGLTAAGWDPATQTYVYKQYGYNHFNVIWGDGNVGFGAALCFLDGGRRLAIGSRGVANELFFLDPYDLPNVYSFQYNVDAVVKMPAPEPARLLVLDISTDGTHQPASLEGLEVYTFPNVATKMSISSVQGGNSLLVSLGTPSPHHHLDVSDVPLAPIELSANPGRVDLLSIGPVLSRTLILGKTRYSARTRPPRRTPRRRRDSSRTREPERPLHSRRPMRPPRWPRATRWTRGKRASRQERPQPKPSPLLWRLLITGDTKTWRGPPPRRRTIMRPPAKRRARRLSRLRRRRGRRRPTRGQWRA